MQETSHQRGLARPQITMQVDGLPGPECAGESIPQRQGGRFIGQVQCNIMRHMLTSQNDWDAFAADIKRWAKELGFGQVGITDTDLSEAESAHREWVAKGFHGAMDYMAKHGDKRTRPAELVPGTVRVISARMDYLPPAARDSVEVMETGELAFISRYALGRDYHKVLRNRLQKLCDKIAETAGTFGYRVFTDSAPVLEVALAEKAGLGWRGKHTLLLSRDAGSWFFLGEIYTDLPLPVDQASQNHCGTCKACIDICPTQAIVAPYEVDARRCISYLTIELKGSIPVELRPLIGNRVYGCDDCQIACPWNRFAEVTEQPDFHVRHGLDDISLVELFGWDEATFDQRMAGSAIYRIGYAQWLRNLAVGLGNAPTSDAVIKALMDRAEHPSELVREHVLWALQRHTERHGVST
jgi:epoxyqueuosine reductase